MLTYLAQRFALAIPTVFGVVTLVFFLIHMTPGDPVDIMLGETAQAADKSALRRQFGLNQPIYVQYGRFLHGLSQGHLGRSLYNGRSVTRLIRDRYPATLQLAGAALLVALAVAVPLAIIAAVRARQWPDTVSVGFALLGVSMPNFTLGPLLILVFAIALEWSPVSGRDGVDHLVLPAITLGLGMAAILTRMLRTALLERFHDDYVRTARAKGLPERRVLLHHVLRNAALSVITVIGLQTGALLAGSVVTETIFAWPGLGRLMLQAIQTRDYPLVQGCVLVIALSYVVINFATDALYAAVDPRIRLQA